MPTANVYHDDCTDCLDTLSYLEDHGFDVTERHLVADALTDTDLDEILEHLDDPIEAVKPELRHEAEQMDVHEIAEYLATDPHRVNHPIVESGGTVYVGYDEDLRASLSS